MPLFPPPLPIPLIIANDGIFPASGTGTFTANVVALWAFEVYAPCTATGMRCHGAATATGTVDMGIYDANGNLLGHTGAVALVANSNNSNAFVANVSLSVGRYFMALCPSNSTDTYNRVSSFGTTNPLMPVLQANNAGTAGVLPNTTGGFVAANASPAMSVILVGGI